MGCLIPNAQASWQVVAHSVPNYSPAMSRLTIDVWSLTGATEQDSWVIPNIES